MAIGNAIGIPFRRGGGISWQTYWATQLTDRFTVAPSADLLAIIKHGGILLNSAGFFDDLDFFYCLKLHTKQASQQNWIQDLYNLTEVNTVTFSQYEGCMSDGTSYFKSGFIPSLLGGKLSLNSHCVGAYGLGPAGNSWPIGAYTPSTTIGFNTSIPIDVWTGNATKITAICSLPGLIAIQRDSETHIQAFNEGISVAENSSNNSISLPTKEFFVLAHNNNGTVFRPIPHYQGFVFGGRSFSPAKHLILQRIITELNLLINSL